MEKYVFYEDFAIMMSVKNDKISEAQSMIGKIMIKQIF